MAGPFIRVNNGENITGKHRRNFWDLQGPASYVNGTGIPVNPSNVGMKAFLSLDATAGGNAAALTWYLVSVLPSPPTGTAYFRAIVRATGAEVANGVNLSAAIFRFEAAGY